MGHPLSSGDQHWNSVPGSTEAERVTRGAGGGSCYVIVLSPRKVTLHSGIFIYMCTYVYGTAVRRRANPALGLGAWGSGAGRPFFGRTCRGHSFGGSP